MLTFQIFGLIIQVGRNLLNWGYQEILWNMFGSHPRNVCVSQFTLNFLLLIDTFCLFATRFRGPQSKVKLVLSTSNQQISFCQPFPMIKSGLIMLIFQAWWTRHFISIKWFITTLYLKVDNHGSWSIYYPHEFQGSFVPFIPQ